MDQPKKFLSDAEMEAQSGPRKFIPDAEMNQAPTNPVAAIGGSLPMNTNFGGNPLGIGKPDIAPGTNAENPDTAELYGNDWQRFKSSFGNTKGVSPLIEGQGYKNAQRNSKGEMVAQWPATGKWYKDVQGIQHPLNWLEGHAGGALPTAGMAVGGVMGSRGGYPGAVVGAGVGSAAGEAARVGAGQLFGTNTGDVLPQVEEEGKQGAMGEAIGKPVGEAIGMIPGVKPAANYVANKTIRPLSAKLANLMTFGSVDTDAAKRLLQRPNEVMGALSKGNVAQVGGEAAKELAGTDARMGTMISKARQEFADKYGTNPVDTTHMVEAIDNAASRNRPNAYGQSSMNPEDFEELERTKNSLGTNVANDGTGAIGANGSQGPQASSQTAGSLQKTADYLQEQSKGFHEKTGNSKFKTSKAAGTAAMTAGQIKEAMHKMSPELTRADQEFSQYAGASPALAGLEKPTTVEPWASNLFGKNKTAYQEAAQKYIPQSYEKLADIGAYKSFGGNDPLAKFGGPTARAVGMFGAGELLSHAAGNPLGLVGGAALGTGAILSHPLVQRSLLGMEGKVLNTQLPAIGAKMINPWANYKESNK